MLTREKQSFSQEMVYQGYLFPNNGCLCENTLKNFLTVDVKVQQQRSVSGARGFDRLKLLINFNGILKRCTVC